MKIERVESNQTKIRKNVFLKAFVKFTIDFLFTKKIGNVEKWGPKSGIKFNNTANVNFLENVGKSKHTVGYRNHNYYFLEENWQQCKALPSDGEIGRVSLSKKYARKQI